MNADNAGRAQYANPSASTTPDIVKEQPSTVYFERSVSLIAISTNEHYELHAGDVSIFIIAMSTFQLQILHGFASVVKWRLPNKAISTRPLKAHGQEI